MIKRLIADFKHTCKYPMGAPDDSHLLELLPTPQERVALKNLLALCKERIWIGRGRERSGVKIDAFKDLMSLDQSDLADASVAYIESYLRRVETHAKKEEDHTQET